MSEQNLGRVNYEALRGATGGVGIDKKHMPAWEQLTKAAQRGFEAAASAVEATVRAQYRDEIETKPEALENIEAPESEPLPAWDQSDGAPESEPSA